LLVYHGHRVRPLFDAGKPITFDDFNVATSREFLGFKHENLCALFEEWRWPQVIKVHPGGDDRSKDYNMDGVMAFSIFSV